MNVVTLVGRLTRDPEVRYTGDSQMAVATFTLACDNGKDKDGNKREADFPRCKAFGKKAEAIEKYVHKGDMFGVHGKISTGSYKNKNGDTVYTTDILVQDMQFLSFAEKHEERQQEREPVREEEQLDGFAAIDEDVPF